MKLTYSQIVTIYGVSISAFPFMYAFDTQSNDHSCQIFCYRIGYFLLGLLGILPGSILIIVGYLIYLVEWLIFGIRNELKNITNLLKFYNQNY